MAWVYTDMFAYMANRLQESIAVHERTASTACRKLLQALHCVAAFMLKASTVCRQQPFPATFPAMTGQPQGPSCHCHLAGAAPGPAQLVPSIVTPAIMLQNIHV
jgi:hypothetical protein